MRKTSKTAQRKAVNSVFTLVRNGDSITNARKVIAKELGLAPATLWSWQNRLDMVTPIITKTTTLVKPHNVTTRTLRSTTKNVQNISNIKTGLGDVFQSLVTKDGRFSTKEASAISQVSSIMLGVARHELDIHKYANKMNKRDISSVRNLLA